MKTSHVLATVSLAAMLAIPASQASAERIKQDSAKANKAFEACSDSGAGVVESGGVTSCIDRKGHGIVCGGVKPEHKGTCDTFIRVPKDPWRWTSAELARFNVKKPKR